MTKTQTQIVRNAILHTIRSAEGQEIPFTHFPDEDSWNDTLQAMIEDKTLSSYGKRTASGVHLIHVREAAHIGTPVLRVG